MSGIPLTANELAQQRTEMGWGRTVMALERTLMAWIRTSLSLISFGFTIFKFLEAMQAKGATMRENAPRNLGLFLILLGVILLVFAIVQFKVAIKAIDEFSERKRQPSLSVIGAVGVLLVGLFTLLNVLFGVGGI